MLILVVLLFVCLHWFPFSVVKSSILCLNMLYIWYLSIMGAVISLYSKRMLIFPKQKYCCKWCFMGAWCHLVFWVHEPISWSGHSGPNETLKRHLLAPYPSHCSIPLSLSCSHLYPSHPLQPTSSILPHFAWSCARIWYRYTYGAEQWELERAALKDQYCLGLA